MVQTSTQVTPRRGYILIQGGWDWGGNSQINPPRLMAPFILQVSHLPRQYLHAGSLTPSSQPSGVPLLNEILEPGIYLALQITEWRKQEGWVTSNLWVLHAKCCLSRKGGHVAKVKDFPPIWQKLHLPSGVLVSTAQCSQTNTHAWPNLDHPAWGTRG